MRKNIISSGEKAYHQSSQPAQHLFAEKNKSMQALQVSSINIIDGMPIIYLGKLLNYSLQKDNRITWVDLITPLVELAAVNGWAIFYLGGEEQVVKKGIEIFKKNFPSLNIFYANGFFNIEKNSPENKAVINKINESHAQILIVGMGMPRQEIWIQENKDALNTNIIFTSGAAIEYIAGAVKTPPRWMGRAGLEWLFQAYRKIQKRFFGSGI